MATLAALELGDLDRSSLEEAFSRYAKTRSASTVRRTMSTWRQFARWLIREGQLATNPMELIEAPGRGPWQPKPLAPEDLAAIAAIVGTVDPTARQPWPDRDQVLFALFVTGGLRASEAINLKVRDTYLRTDPPRLRVEGKGNRIRSVVIPPETVRLVATTSPQRHRQHRPPLVCSSGPQATHAPLPHRPPPRTARRSGRYQHWRGTATINDRGRRWVARIRSIWNRFVRSSLPPDNWLTPSDHHR